MAEAIELNFPPGKKNSDDINNIVEETVRELTKEVNEKDETGSLQRYHIENYYEGDTLGADVLITRSDVTKGHPDYYLDIAKKIAIKKNAFYINQFANQIF